MFGVDGHDLAGRGRVLDERAAHDERLLVRQRQGVAGMQRGESRREPDRTGHAVQHDAGSFEWPARDLGGGVRPRDELERRTRDAGPRRRGRQRRFEVGRRAARDPDNLDVELGSLIGNQIEPVSTGSEPDDAEQVGIASNDVERLGADGSGRPQDDDVPALAHLTSVSYRPGPGLGSLSVSLDSAKP